MTDAILKNTSKKITATTFIHSLKKGKNRIGNLKFSTDHVSSRDFIKFSSHRSYIASDMFLICRMTSYEQVIKRSYDLVGGGPSPKSSPHRVWWSQVLRKWRYEFLNLQSYNLTISHNQRVVWLYGWDPLTISHHLIRLATSRIGDMLYLICTWLHMLMLLKSNGTFGPCMILWLKSNRTFECKLLTVCHYPAKIGGCRHCDSGDMFIICNLTSRTIVYKVPCDSVKPLIISHHSVKFGGYSNCDKGNISQLIYQVITRYYYG